MEYEKSYEFYPGGSMTPEIKSESSTNPNYIDCGQMAIEAAANDWYGKHFEAAEQQASEEGELAFEITASAWRGHEIGENGEFALPEKAR